MFEDLLTWRKEAWQDHWDGFDYHKAMPELLFPPSLYFVSLQQRWLKPEIDCRNFMFELPNHDGRMIKLSVKAGNQKNYSVSELCSSIDAETDYYPLLLTWLQDMSGQPLRST